MPPIRAWRRVSRPTRCRSTAARDNRGRAAAPKERPAVDHELPAAPRTGVGRAESSAGPAADKDCVERAFVLAPDVDDRLRLLLELGDEPSPLGVGGSGRCDVQGVSSLSLDRPAAIDNKQLAGHEVRLIRGQVNRGGGNIRWLTDATPW